MTQLLVATRSAHKLREIQQILSARLAVHLVSLGEFGAAELPEEEEIEQAETFQENALAKARYFSGRTGMLTLADDSGLCVEALGGRPGVRSKRYSGKSHLSGPELDRANNDLLLDNLAGIRAEARGAEYVCAAAISGAGTESVAVGRWPGRVLTEPRGTGGFGYDPLILIPVRGQTVAELPTAAKNSDSHRARALLALLPAIAEAVDKPLPHR